MLRKISVELERSSLFILTLETFSLEAILEIRLCRSAVEFSNLIDSCDGSLASGLPAASFRSSSHFSESRAANFAKLNRRDGGGGWSPQLTDRLPWLQLDLRARMEVTAVATQGRHGSHDWVGGYTLLYSDSGSVWKEYRNEDRVASCSQSHGKDKLKSDLPSLGAGDLIGF
ncbi:contactin-associated protein-like 5 isoform X1 [Tachysurus ichikawai]